MRRSLLPTFWKCLLICSAVLFSMRSYSQVDISIGTGTTGNTDISYPAPLQDFYEGSRAQYLYLASELTAAGMAPGTINSIKFNVTNTYTMGSIEQYTIKIGTTTTTSLSATSWEPGANTVFGPVDYLPTVGVNTFTFTAPFFWNGSDNIVVEICNGALNTTSGTFWTDNASTPWTTGLSFNGSHTYRADDLDNLCNTATTTNTGTQTTRPNIIFSWTPATACSGTPTAGTAQTSATNTCTGQNFTLSLTGNTIASGITYQWQSSPDNVTWTNVPGGTTSSFVTSQTASNYYRAVVTCTNGGATATSTSVQVTTPPAVSGTFTINKAVPTNIGTGTFNSFNDAYNYIKCGINGAVVFNVLAGSGPYNEQLIIAPVPGASATNTVTFNGNNNVISYGSTNTNERAVIKLNGADYFRFNNLVITASGTTTSDYGWGVQLINDADFNIFNGNTINVDAILASTNFVGIVISASHTSATTTGAGSKSDNNTFSNNTVNGGYYGITSVGSTAAADIISNNSFTGNTVQNFYLYGMYISGNTGTLIEGNDLKRPARTTSGFSTYGIYFTGSLNSKISKNRIHAIFDSETTTTSDFYGIYVTGSDATTTEPNVISNNVIYEIKSNGGIYALYNSSSNNARYYFNTISLDHTASSSTDITRGFYQITTASGIELRNNIFSITRGGSGTKHVIYMATATTTYLSNNNDLYILSGSSNYTGYNGTNRVSLADWRTASSQDGASIAVDPLFDNPAAGSFKPTSAVVNDLGVPIAGITTDILNVVRNATTPDIGAFEFTVPPCTAPPTGGTATSTETTVCSSSVPFTVSATGASVGTGLTYQWQQSTDGGTTWTNIAGATSYSYSSTGISATTMFRRQITCSSQTATSTAVTVTLSSPQYVALPYYESFETTWIDGCATRDIPNVYWRNTPPTGNDSWRRNDDGASAWTNTFGGYTPTASDGSYSARFHSYQAPDGAKGRFDLHVNANTAAANKRLQFDVINTTGDDSLTIFISTNGGTSFTRLDSTGDADDWRTKTILFNSMSATTIIRFEATSDFGFTDIGLDNISVIDFADCSGTPVAGTAVTSSAMVCTEPFTLSLTGSGTAAGLLYQWQSSTDNATWTDIPGATTFNYTTSQVGTTYYRAVVTCTFSTLSGTSTSVQVVSPTPVSGTFTINNANPTNIPTGTFNNFNDAYDYIKCGINGPVVFNVQTGTGQYTEQLIMNPVPGASATNTVTFRGNGVATIGFASANANERAVIKLRGADYIIFDSLVINATTGTYGYGIQLMPNSDSNVISNNIINLNTSATTQNFAGVVINFSEAGPISTGSVFADYNTIMGNTITGGYYGITLTATTAGANGYNRIVGNRISDFHNYGIYTAGSYGTIIDSNYISRPARTTVSDFIGIYLTGVHVNARITKNRIFDPFGGAPTATNAFTGISFNGVDALIGSENIVSNNLIYNVTGNGAQTGISNTSSDNVYYLHNTIALDHAPSTASGTTRGFFQTTTAGGIYFFDNMVTIRRGGTGTKHAIYLATATTSPIMDYNNYYINAAGTSNFVGFSSGANRATLADWQTATGQDGNSLSRDPFYTNPATGNYKPQNGAIDDKGTYVGINVDIENALRNLTTPDIGAYEFTAPPCTMPPVAGNTVFSDTTVCQMSPVRLNLSISAWGATQTFQWERSATGAAGSFTSFGSLLNDPDTTILADTSMFYRVAVTCGGVTVYSNELQLLVSPALPQGTYTINKALPTNYVPGTAGGNFTSFNDAKAAMGCGILGPIVFDVVTGSGPYNEQLRLDSIPGTSPVNTITFNGNGNTIAFASANSNERAVIKLSGADYIIFDSLVIDATGGTYGYGVQLLNNSDTNIFRKNTILTSTTNISANFAGIVINSIDAGAVSPGNTRTDGNWFDMNTIVGGYYGITAVGNTTAAGAINDNRFTNNTISEFYNYGFYVQGTYNTTIEANTFTRPTRVTSPASIYGVYVTGTLSNRLNITRNTFHTLFGGAPTTTNTQYGIYHNSVDVGTGNETMVTNNLFYNLVGNGPVYALYNLSSSNVWYYHNTISLDDAASTATGLTAAFYQTTTASGLQFKNNIVTIDRGGPGNKFAIYLNTTATNLDADYNDYYLTAANAYVGFRTTAHATLASWRTATGDDANSVTMNPLYTDPATGNYKPQLGAIDNMGTPLNVMVDILNQPRSATTPDIGAYEFSPTPCTTPPVPGVATVTPAAGICLEAPIELDITGHSALGSITFQWQSSFDGTTGWTNISPVQFFPEFSTTAGTNTYFRAAVTCNGNTVYTNVTNVVLNPILLSGTYTINNTTPTTYVPGATSGNFNSFQEAVNAMLCGVGGPIVFNVAAGTYNEKINIPYIPNTNATNTVTFNGVSGSPSSVNLSAAGTLADNYTLRLDSTRYFTFRNMTFTATNATYGRVIELVDSASHINIVGNNIVMPVVTLASNNVSGVIMFDYEGVNVNVFGNTVTNGSHGIVLTGGGITDLTKPGHVIDSNTVTGSYVSGIYTQYTNRLPITRNTVSFTTPVQLDAVAIYANYADSAFRISNNTVNISNTSNRSYGIRVNNSRSVVGDSSIINSNRVVAAASNTGIVYGLSVSGSKTINVVNNTVAINGTSATAYGLHHLNNTSDINWYNNTANFTNSAAAGYAAWFSNTATGNFQVFNNVFSNKGGGAALYVNNPAFFTADYNMLFTTGPTLVEVATGSVTDFASLKDWVGTWNWDRSSISFEPSFVAEDDLRPNLTDPNVWAMHGRGVQIRGNDYDFNYIYRPDSLTAGVPDLGAYEFYPTVDPAILLASAPPAPNTTQVFSFGTDTVMRITWGPTAPSAVQVKRFSGVVPSGLLPGTDSMFFYTKVDVTGTNDHNYGAKLYYIDSWRGSIPQEWMIGLGRTTPSNAWVVGQNSKVDVGKNEISQDALIYMDRFTGLVNAYATPDSDDSSSNRGKDFWIGYQRSNAFSEGNSQQMVLYFGAGDSPANVTVTIEGTSGTPWVRNYLVPANSSLSSDFIPKVGVDDARLFNPGLYAKLGIHITSDVPIVAYAHTYSGANSGATMLMPTPTWGYEYYVLTSRQNYSSASSSAFHFVAKEDSTWVEVNPSRATRNGMVPNGGTQPNGSYLIKLNKGDAFQVLGAILSGSEGHDMTGSYVKSISNAQGECHPIAVFSGSTRTGIGCGTSAGGSGDMIVQQIFPYQAWGTTYLTAPTSNQTGPTATSNMTNIYRVMVKDPTTVVRRNGVIIPAGTLIASRYYQFESNVGELIEANKPVLVAQYMSSSGSCPNTSGDGDPEMFYISPLQQSIKKTQFYRNREDNIDLNFITIVIPTEGLSSLRIDGINYLAYPATDRFVNVHPGKPGYSIVTKKWLAGAAPGASGSSTVESDHPFTGIVYGIGSVESYGYNVGTLVKNLNNLSTVDNTLNVGTSATEYTCKGAPFQVTALLPLVPDSLLFQFSLVAKLSPSTDVMLVNPIPSDTVTVNGVEYYAFELSQSFTIDSAGTFQIPIQFWSPEIESCDKRKAGAIIVQVLPKPITDFTITYSSGNPQGCEGDMATFTGDIITSNGIALNQWQWTFHDASTANGQVQSRTYTAPGTYDVKLRGVTADGCIADTTKQVVINAKPVVTLVQDNINACPGDNVTFTIASPIAGATYNWYDAATGGTLLGTGTSFTVTGVTPPMSFYVEGINNGCPSAARKQVTVSPTSALAPAVVTVSAATATSVTFSWTPVTGAVSYQVSVNGGAFGTPSSGAAGTTHTVSGLGTLTSTSIVVRAQGATPCEVSNSAPVSGCTNSSATVAPLTQEICKGANATFTVTSPEAGITYNWYSTATGGTALATGVSYTANNVQAATDLYVEQTNSTTGCTSTTRTKVSITLSPDLANPVVTADSIRINSIRFTWQPVAGATGYQVSLDNGTTWIAPSGPGLVHIVTGLRPAQEVTLIVRALGVCGNTETELKARSLPDRLFVPNSFSPNGDGLNDRLMVYGYGVQDIRFMVFNQWGEKVFETTSQSAGWDGMYKGKAQPSGVYMYVCTATLTDGTKLDMKGSINLIR